MAVLLILASFYVHRIKTGPEGVDLLPANIELSGLEVTLVNTMSRETILREYLNSVREQYDVILLDLLSTVFCIASSSRTWKG